MTPLLERGGAPLVVGSIRYSIQDFVFDTYRPYRDARNASCTNSRSTKLSGSPTHLLLEVTSRYMSVGEPDYN